MTSAIVMLLISAIFVVGFVAVVEPGPEGAVQYLRNVGRLFLFRHGLVKELSPVEIERLYRSVCTKNVTVGM